MILSSNIHWFAAMALERLLYCLTAGIVMVAVIAVVLRLVPGKNSQTQFAVCFSTLLAVALLPVIAFEPFLRSVLPRVSAPSQALIAIPASWAEYIVLAWGAVAMVGVLRVLAGIWQLRRLRRGCLPLDLDRLSSAAKARITEISRRRAVSILVSSEVEIPTAIGFFRPAILIPAWLAEDSAAIELQYVLLHELAHLERWDDWSNLVQKLIKSVLFFHPAVWWIERKLSIEREIACDDAVLAQSPNPRVYAECLTRVAEKRFLRRQLALAQAAVGRVKQLSSRVARILSSDAKHSTRLWKPAVPMVLAVAAICGVSTLKTTELVRFTDPQATTSASAPSGFQIPLVKNGRAGDQVLSAEPIGKASEAKALRARAIEAIQAKAWPASLKTYNKDQKSFIPARHRIKSRKPSPALRSANSGPTMDQAQEAPALLLLSSFDAPLAKHNEEVPAGAIVVVMATQRVVSTSSGTWHFSTWELRLVVPNEHQAKPIPRKT